MKTSRRNWVAAAVVAGLLIAGGAGSAQAGSYSWTGNGDVNNSGNWSDGANWGGTAPGGADTATLENVVSGTRVVTVDTPTSVLTLNWTPSGAARNSSTDRMLLEADLTVGTLNSSDRAYLDINGHTLTITNACAANKFPWIVGTGTVVKNGTWTWKINNEDHPPFTGQWQVNNGILDLSGYNRFGKVYSNLTVASGATVKLVSLADWLAMPRPLIINGPGYLNQGALWDGGNTYNQSITLQSDSAIAVDSAKTMQMFGVIDGPGELLKSGNGALVLMNANTYSGATIVSNGTLKVLGSLTATASITVKNGATLIGSAGHFNVTPTIESGGTWIQDNIAAWSGNGNPDNSGNWSDTNNWYGQTVPTVAATLNSLAGAGTRTVTVDVPTAVDTLTWPGSSGNRDQIVLGADLTVGTMDASQSSYLDINGYTLTITDACAAYKFPWIVGTGTVVKTGTWTWMMNQNNNHPPFTGSWQVNGGLLYIAGYNRFGKVYSNMTVASGATVKLGKLDDWATMPRPLIINGPGYFNQGALWDTYGNTYNQSITVQSDATIFIDPAKTMILTAALNGSGTLTVTGGGTLSISSTSSAHDGIIIVTEASLSVSTILPSVTNITVLTGGVLNGAQAHFPNADVVVSGGTWNSVDQSNAWSGNGNSDNSGNWSDPNNWFGGAPLNEAVLPSVVGSVARTVTVDVATSVPKLTWPGTAGKDLIELDADLTIGTVVANDTGDPGLAQAWCAILMNGHEVTITNACALGQMFYPSGAGTITKQGGFTLELNYDNGIPFTGTWVAANGTLKLHGYNRIGYPTAMVIQNGATLENQNNVDGHVPPLFLNGNGYNNAGALNQLQTSGGDIDRSGFGTNSVTLQTDSKITVQPDKTLTLYGPLNGPGVMTLAGGGTMKLTNRWDYAVSGASANGIIVTNATVDIAGCTLTISGLGSASATEYALVDYSAANGNLVGSSFAAVNGLTSRWEIDYDGTDAHPDAVVLVLPPPLGTMLIIR